MTPPIETMPPDVREALRGDAIDLCYARNLLPFNMAPDGRYLWEHAAHELALLKSALYILRYRGHIP